MYCFVKKNVTKYNSIEESVNKNFIGYLHKWKYVTISLYYSRYKYKL